MNFFSGYTNFFCSRNDATGKDLSASDLEGIVNELSEDWHWIPLLAVGEQQHPPHTMKWFRSNLIYESLRQKQWEYAHVTFAQVNVWGKRSQRKRGGGDQGCSKKVSIKVWATELSNFLLPHPLDIFKCDLNVIYPAFLKSISIFLKSNWRKPCEVHNMKYWSGSCTLR